MWLLGTTREAMACLGAAVTIVATDGAAGGATSASCAADLTDGDATVGRSADTPKSSVYSSKLLADRRRSSKAIMLTIITWIW
ncbi:hypothetical protein ACVWY3_003270 [Bradyrhizobium sp. USDA 4486]